MLERRVIPDYGTYSLLEASQVCGTQSICLCYNWDQVDSGTQSLHHFNVQGLQGVSRGSDEVQASVYSEIDFVNTSRLLLLQHVRLMLVIQELDNWHPRVAVVDIVSKAGCIDYGQAYCQRSETSTKGAVQQTLEELLFQFGLCDLDFNGLVHLLGVSALVIGVVLNGRRKERIDECRLSQSRLASNLQVFRTRS